MNLTLLAASTHQRAYYDTWNHWLYVEWAGALSLAAAQRTCLALAECYLAHPYPRVLFNQAQVLHLEAEVPGWLARHFFPYLSQAGPRHVAWVCSPTPYSRAVAEAMLAQLPGLPARLFDEVEPAAAWLQLMRASAARSGAERPVPSEQLTQLVAGFRELLLGHPV